MSKARRAARSVGRSMVAGINFKTIAQSIIPVQLGFFAFKAAAKFGGGDGMTADQNDRDSWNTASFFKGALGTFGAALLCKAFRPQWSQEVMAAGLNMAIYNLIQIKLIPNSEWAMTHLGEDDYVPNEFSGGMHLAAEMPDGTPMFAGADGELYPADESYRLPENVSGAIVPRNYLGDALVQPGRLGGADYLEPYRRAWGVPS